MMFKSNNRLRLIITGCCAAAFFASSFGMNGASVSADEPADKANNMLENLKKRNAEERWQRVKRLYPSEQSVARPNSPAQLSSDQAAGLSGSDLPPSPEQTTLIPRLAAFPVDASNDWVLPNPQTLQNLAEPLPDIVPSPEPIERTTPSNVRPTRAPVSVAAQEPRKPDETLEIDRESGKQEMAELNREHVVRERKISDINPFYDRDRDDDMRKFAQEKSKEFDFSIKHTPFVERNFPLIAMTWEPSNFYYYPLYFADPALERYGHEHHPILQPFASIARAGVQAAFLPYQMVIDPICEEVYALGYYRPGDCTPKLHYQVPLNPEAAVVQAGFVTGLYFIIP